MNLAEAVAARRSVRAFQDRAVPRDIIERAISLAVQAPAPHHSAPWRFALLEAPAAKERLALDMGAAWRDDLTADGLANDRIEAILSRSERLLRSAPLLTVCCADLSRSHAYPDDRRKLAEWSLFAHSIGAALQIYMTALAESGVASCWISAPVFCGERVKKTLSLPPRVEPHALALVGYASPDYRPRPRPHPDPRDYIL